MKQIAGIKMFVVLCLTLTPTGLVHAQSDETVTSNADWEPVVETVSRDALEMDLVLVPAGSFMIGSTEEEVFLWFSDCESVLGEGNCQYDWFSREAPQAEVTFAEPFWIGQTEVTNAQYRTCVDAGACTPPADTTFFDDSSFDEHPVIYVSWNQALEFADWVGGRVPSEAEWEYAARGVDRLTFPWGDEFDGTVLNFCDSICPRDWRNSSFEDGYERTSPVGEYPDGASWVGALDMGGNVWEWTVNIFHETTFLYPYDKDDGRELIDNEGRNEARIRRGGSWENVPRDLRTAGRSAIPFPMNGMVDTGFRIVMDEIE